MISRAETLTVGRIECIRDFHIAPADEILDGTCSATVAVERDVE